MTNQGMVIWSEITLKTVATHPNNMTAIPDPESARLSFLTDYLKMQAAKTTAQLQQQLCNLDKITHDLMANLKAGSHYPCKGEGEGCFSFTLKCEHKKLSFACKVV